MAGSLLMERQKKTPSEPEMPEFDAEYVRIKKEGGFGAKRIALRDDFFEKLKLIAESLDVPPGSIVEARLRRYVKAELPAAVKRKEKMDQEASARAKRLLESE